jgi:hypothetical protein
MKNLTYEQLIELAPKDRPFQIKIDDTKDKIWVFCDKTTELKYDKNNSMQKYKSYKIYDKYNNEIKSYKAKFTLIDPKYQKPEVLKVGQKVRIMESARECGAYEGWVDDCKGCVGTTDTIIEVTDKQCGIYYRFKNSYTFPHYCVMPVEDDEVQEIPELENTLEQLDNLVSKAQDIISKYKK